MHQTSVTRDLLRPWGIAAAFMPAVRLDRSRVQLRMGARQMHSVAYTWMMAALVSAGPLVGSAVARAQTGGEPPAVPAVDEQQLATSPTLELVVRYALEHNPAIPSASHAVEAAEQRVTREQSYRNPMVTFGPDTGNMAETRAGPQGNAVALSQEVPFPGKLTLRGDIARDEARALQEQFRATIDEVSRQARARYADYYLAARALEVNAETTELARQFASIAEAKYRVGTAAQQDVIQAQEKLSLLVTERVAFEGQEQTALGALNAILDRQPRAPIGRPPALETRELTVSLAELVDQAAEARPELRAQDHVVQASERSVTLAKMGFLPDFSVGGQYVEVGGGTNPTFAQDGHDIWMAMLGLSVPLWIDRIEAEIDESRARVLEQESTRRNLGNVVSDQVQRAYEAVRVAARTEEIFRKTLIPQTQERVGAARAGYETGQVDFLTLINSLDSLERTELDRFRAVHGYQQALADLDRAVGKPVPSVPAGGRP